MCFLDHTSNGTICCRSIALENKKYKTVYILNLNLKINKFAMSQT